MTHILIPVILGFLSVAQNGLNRNFGLSNGLSTAVLINTAVGVLLSAALWILARYLTGDDLSWLKGALSLDQFRAWHLLPGIFGFLVVLGIPFAINQLGATRVFVGFVGAQVLGALLWDLFAAQTPILGTRVIGALLTIAGILLVSFR